MKSRDSLIRLKRFQVEEKRRQVSQIEMMIAEFERMARDLDDQIVIEQDRSGIHDTAHFAYPTFARAAMQRRDNLRASALELEGQRNAAQEDLNLSLEELQKYEALAERDTERGQIEGEAVEPPPAHGRRGGRSAVGGERRSW
ncbi:flagellar export protein FliJ [Kaistia dalseonensis]|uniref:Flagellar export protein FliJ n=1 Tax=Kaistia dalseonensis TaxID=410840 RepID=A0ABU0H9P3_9HYPH|nr:flagellar export protein FliJ [Kaistia dalseonensis]MCX5496417.1 flagellar export protein FliJ [Kaistia dalseonensis]MDQ0439038.1 flagellar export protein FliJ [Kaistia dalseonensis]